MPNINGEAQINTKNNNAPRTQKAPRTKKAPITTKNTVNKKKINTIIEKK
jgi:hypothetical protein